jgi:hypothetical protein
MPESTTARWVVGILVALAIVALLAYVRGDDSDRGRSPERESSLPALTGPADRSDAMGVGGGH